MLGWWPGQRWLTLIYHDLITHSKYFKTMNSMAYWYLHIFTVLFGVPFWHLQFLLRDIFALAASAYGHRRMAMTSSRLLLRARSLRRLLDRPKQLMLGKCKDRRTNNYHKERVGERRGTLTRMVSCNWYVSSSTEKGEDEIWRWMDVRQTYVVRGIDIGVDFHQQRIIFLGCVYFFPCSKPTSALWV